MKDNVKDVCWNLFKETGEINYYMLYKALDEREDE